MNFYLINNKTEPIRIQMELMIITARKDTIVAKDIYISYTKGSTLKNKILKKNDFCKQIYQNLLTTNLMS